MTVEPALTLSDVEHFLLTFFRVTGVLMIAPVFGSDQVPIRVRIYLSLVVAFLMWPLVDRTGAVVSANLWLYLFAVLLEWGTGILIGMAARMLFAAVQFGGQIVGMELGLTIANVIDPITQASVSILSQLQLLLATMIYLAIDGHHFLLTAMRDSFRSIPLMGAIFHDGVGFHLSDTMATDLFVIAIKVAGPALVAMLLTTVALAFMARAAPEMNIFVIGFTVRLIFGLLVVALAMPAFQYVFGEAYDLHRQGISDLIQGLRGP